MFDESQMYLYLLIDNNDHKKAKGKNKNVATISHNEYKVVLLNKKCLRHFMNKIQSKDHRFLCLALLIKYTSKIIDVMD